MQALISNKLCQIALLAVLSLFSAGQTLANGEVGEHVNDLTAHLDQYAEEIDWLLGEVDSLVSAYGENGSADAERVTEIWEEVDFHAAIEVNYVPIYASIWQGLFGVRTAMEAGQPLAEVRHQQDLLQQSFWQALGAVKMAAQMQQRGVLDPVAVTEPTTPMETMDEILQRLERVVAKYAEQLPDEATDIVHDTYLTLFEGLEGTLIEADAELVLDLEKDFNVTLPQALQGNASLDEVRAVVQDMLGKLGRARTIIETAEENRASVF